MVKIVTNLAIPDDVYLFYLKVSNHLENCTPEDAIVDALTRYAAMVSQEILQNHHISAGDSQHPTKTSQ